MEITHRSDYACRILRSAYRHRDACISIADVAREEDVPYAFARTIQHDLAAAGYLRTVRGAHGGLTLAIDPEKVTVYDVVCLLQSPVATSACSADPSVCEKSSHCAFHKVWCAIDQAIESLLSSITLMDIFQEDRTDACIEAALQKANGLIEGARALDVAGDAPCAAPSASAGD